MHADPVVNAIRRGFPGRGVRGDDEGFVTGPAQVLEHPEHGVADTVDFGEEGFGDDGNAHTTTVSAPPVAKVACEHTSREICWSEAFNPARRV